MGLGISYKSSSTFESVPRVQYDARAGRFTRIDRENPDGSGWTQTEEDITGNFVAVMDFENIEVGWMDFSGKQPFFQLAPINDDYGEKPTDNAKEGFRIMLKLGKDIGGETPVREWCSNAKVVGEAVSQLHDEYLAGLKSHPGSLPVVALTGTQKVTSGSGEKTSTNYGPVWEIKAWVKRPADLVFVAKGGHADRAPAAPAAAAAPAANGGRPATGSTKVSAPAAKAAPAKAPPAKAAPAEADWG